MDKLAAQGWLRHEADRIALTPAGRMLSNDIFSRLLN
jgi:coproporphyrinogen III oxidase-like Fe-S oxidoreductase